ncbi:hypothetical protein BDV27DRAFT_132727 [Aspergillus caelatus]|uniref:Uncharacterized protein n=1 Tax=Aspergillus caelatus TaxID=61420 RepID=A0A5N6ZZC1_9EURO|nr:uncharacterized protein BDV27DRAFT_132727 [Aspergillus caelatus]KAE8361640.1 hypothetical protein BDV27DRAFT_132727 [Aspergillus caelatus]
MMGIARLPSSDVTQPSGSDNARLWSIKYRKRSCLIGILLGAMDSLCSYPHLSILFWVFPLSFVSALAWPSLCGLDAGYLLGHL